MKNRLARAAGAVSMLWSLVVLGAPAPFSDCAMSSMSSMASSGMHMGMDHHGSMSHDAGQAPSGPTHDRPAHASCCSLACCCGSFAPLPPSAATAGEQVGVVDQPRPVVFRQRIPLRAPHSLPFAHAPPLS